MAPMVHQLITSGPPATKPKPRMLPTMEWVEDTGKAVSVAASTQTPAESRAANMPIMRILWSGIMAGLMMPLLMVAVTWEPSTTEPRKLSGAAMSTAWRTLMALEPTAVAMELATSLAPRLKAMRKPAPRDR